MPVRPGRSRIMPALLALPLLGLLSAPALAQTEQRSVQGDRVAIYNLAGRVRAVAGTGSAVTVDVTRAGADAAKLRVETGVVGSRQTLRVLYPADRVVYPDERGSRTTVRVRENGTFSDGDDDFTRDRVTIRSSGPGLEAHADLVVHVPKGQRLELYLAVGRIDVVNVSGDLALDVHAAEVDVAGLQGALSLDSGSGRVSVRDVTGNLSIDSGSGGLTVERVKGDVLEIDSGSGGIQGSDVQVRELKADIGSGGLRLARVTAPVVDVETGSGGTTLELLGSIERIDVESGSGGVTLRVPANLGAEVDAETGSGGFQTDFAVTTRRISRNHLEGRIGDGHARISIESGSGAVRLLRN